MLQCFSWLADWRLGSCHMTGYSRLLSVSVMIRHLSIYLSLLPCTPSMPSLSSLASLSHLVLLSLYTSMWVVWLSGEGGGSLTPCWPRRCPSLSVRGTSDRTLPDHRGRQTTMVNHRLPLTLLWSTTDYGPPQTTVAPYRPRRPTTHHEGFHMCHSGLCFHYVLSDLFKPFIPPSLSSSNAIFTSSVFSLSHWGSTTFYSLSHWGSTILYIRLIISLHLSLTSHYLWPHP